MRLVAATGLLVLAVAATPGSAGVYEVTACGPDGVGSGAWSGASSPQDVLEITTICPPTGRVSGLVVRDRSGAASTPNGAVGEWTFQAPAGTRIVGIQGRRLATARLDDGWRAYLRAGDGRTLEECTPGPGGAICDLGLGGAPGAPEPGPFAIDGLEADRVSFGVRCEIPPGQLGSSCINGSGNANAVYAARDLVVRLADPVPPSTVTADGALRSASQRWVSGVQTLQVAAADGQAGVARVGILAGSRIAATTAAPCNPSQAAPCPAQFTGLVTLDTRTLPDGPTDLAAFASDAGGEQTSTSPWSVLIDNTPPAVGVAPAEATVHAGRPFTVKWPRDGGAPIVRADWRLVPLEAGRTQAGVAVAAALRSFTVTAPTSGTYQLRTILRDAAGNRGGETTTTLFVRRAQTVGTAGAASITVRSGRLVAVIEVGRSPRARQYVVNVVRDGTAKRLFRAVRAGTSKLSVPIGPPATGSRRATLTYRLTTSSSRRTIRLALPPLRTTKGVAP